MRNTTAESLRRIRDESKQPSEIYAKVLQIDYLNKQVQVQIGSRATWVQVVSSLDLGTRQNPKVIPGGEIQLVRWGGNAYVAARYIATNYLPLVGTSIGAGVVAQMLGAPAFFSVIQRGVQLEANWSAVQGAIAYELYSNTIPSANGAKLVTPAGFVGTSYQLTISGGNSVLIPNGGFESGDLSRWAVVSVEVDTPTGNPDQIAVTGVEKYSGNYALKAFSGGGSNGSQIASEFISINPATSQKLQTRYKIIDPTATATLVLYFTYHNAAFEYLSGSSIAVISETATTVWKLAQGGIESNPNAKYIQLYIEFFCAYGGTATFYVDDVAVVGTPETSASSLVYAVRAIGAQGQASPFSAWLQPTVQRAALGDPSRAHTQLDYANAAISVSNFVGGEDAGNNAGARINENGIDGNLLVAPKSATLWHDESVVLAGNALAHVHNTNQDYGVTVYQNTPANGDTFEQKVFLRPGWYTFNVLGTTDANRGIVDWYLDDVKLLAGQDWYAAAIGYNVVKASSVPFVVQYGGAHTLKAVVNGKNASSTSYYLVLTKMWFAPASVAETALYLKFNYPQYSGGLIPLGVL
jgi:hypothetical protein